MISTIGCCDSGLGGLLCVDALHNAYPKLNIVFIADQMNAPYGEKKLEQLTSFATDIFAIFKNMNISDIVVACNTLCCNGTEQAKKLYPELNVRTIIQPTYEQLIGNKYKTINVLATSKTVQTHIYKNALEKIFPEAYISEIEAPKLVPIIENGYDLKSLKHEVENYCKLDADAWILGCTHYPLIRPFIKTKGDIYDSIQPIIDFYKDKEINGEGTVRILTTGDPKKMKESIKTILGKDYSVEHIKLKQS